MQKPGQLQKPLQPGALHKDLQQKPTADQGGAVPQPDGDGRPLSPAEHQRPASEQGR